MVCLDCVGVGVTVGAPLDEAVGVALDEGVGVALDEDVGVT